MKDRPKFNFPNTKETSSDAARQFQTKCLWFSLVSFSNKKYDAASRSGGLRAFPRSEAPVDIRLEVKLLMASVLACQGPNIV
jgi:hypothetical protein